jgi:hypothetical protein
MAYMHIAPRLSNLRRYHYKRLFVADTHDRGCLNKVTLAQRIRDFENDEEHHSCARIYWNLFNRNYTPQLDIYLINAKRLNENRR